MTLHSVRSRTVAAPPADSSGSDDQRPVLPRVSSAVTDVPVMDRALAVFLRKRIAEADAYGCAAEQKALAGVGEVLAEFEAKHPRHAQMAHDDFFTAQIDTLRWVLRCVATGAFSAHPEFQPVFNPSIPVLSQSTEFSS
ncbi:MULTISPECIES: hypothetical protein [unclassified Streptomyces]|uniref:hypothetical protein n=1 Tax=unclassified Streptomyces TaxID=2593676 RepID=UPI002E2A34DA|nr:hypothetical protein [Streptomyces sp. NBC_00239]